MSFKDFILNGGVLGKIRNFDNKKEGRPYGFGELQEDALEAISASRRIFDEGSYALLETMNVFSNAQGDILPDMEFNDERK